MAKETQHERETNDGMDELDEFMDGLGDGTVTVKCTRLDPPLGYCGEFWVTKNNPLTLKELKRRFGGRVFQLNSRSSNGQIRKQKTVSIDDVPRREGIEILPDGSTARTNENGDKPKQEEPDALSVLMKSGLPPAVMRQVLPYMVGLGGFPVEEKKKPDQQNNTFELMQQQAVMDMMNNQMRAQMEFQKDMQRQRREMEESQKPKNPYSDMEMVFKMLREIQGFKTELGGGDNLAADALQSAVGLAETGLSEFLSLKKLQMQAELAKIGSPEPRRDLPPRRPPAQLDRPRVIKEQQDPVQLARQMGDMFRKLSDDERQAAMAAFLGTDAPENSDYIENQYNDDTIEDGEQYLDADDQEIFNSATDENQPEADHVSHSEHATPANNNDSFNRQGDSGGIPTPSH